MIFNPVRGGGSAKTKTVSITYSFPYYGTDQVSLKVEYTRNRQLITQNSILTKNDANISFEVDTGSLVWLISSAPFSSVTPAGGFIFERLSLRGTSQETEGNKKNHHAVLFADN